MWRVFEVYLRYNSWKEAFMPNKIQLPPAKSFEELWAMIQESRQESNEWRKETERQMKESAAETDKRFKEVAERFKESSAELDKRFKEVAEQFKQTAAETDKRFKEVAERFKETERQMKENAAETDKRFKEVAERFKQTEKMIKENGRQLGDVHNRLGELVEHIVLPNILEKVKPLGYGFEYVRKRYEFTDKNFRVIAEADILLINGEYLMVIEVKTVLKTKDIDGHLKRLESIRREACPPYESRKFIGCVAGAVVDEAVKRYAHKKGLYVLEQAGDTLKLEVPEGFKPVIW
jgi:small-conductance mechanosensitive channel